MLKQYYRNTKKFSTALPREVLYVPPWPALGGWGPPTYNTLLLTHSIYVNKQKHRFILTNAYETIFYSTNAAHKADSSCYASTQENDFFQVFKNANVFVNSY